MKTKVEPIKIRETNKVEENGSAANRVKMEEGSDRDEEPSGIKNLLVAPHGIADLQCKEPEL
ncbi:hypothetical protein P3S67_032345 [Capsicum chacoense]